MPNLFTTNHHIAIASIYKEMEVACVNALANEGVQELNNERFDLVMLHSSINDCFLSFVHQLQVCSHSQAQRDSCTYVGSIKHHTANQQ